MLDCTLAGPSRVAGNLRNRREAEGGRKRTSDHGGPSRREVSDSWVIQTKRVLEVLWR